MTSSRASAVLDSLLDRPNLGEIDSGDADANQSAAHSVRRNLFNRDDIVKADRIRLLLPVTRNSVWLPIAVIVVVVIVVGLVVFGWGRVARSAPIEDSLPVAGESGAQSPTAAKRSATTGPQTSERAALADGASVDAAPTESKSSSVFVHVVGAVAAPGVVRLPSDGRVVDAVAAAGGLRVDADPDRVNLAAPLSDGSRIVVPVVGQEPPIEVPVVGASVSGVGGRGDGSGSPTIVNINAADAKQLEELPGVGPATAAAIVSKREKDGPFKSVESLLDVRGIGDAKMEAIRDLVTVG